MEELSQREEKEDPAGNLSGETESNQKETEVEEDLFGESIEPPKPKKAKTTAASPAPIEDRNSKTRMRNPKI